MSTPGLLKRGLRPLLKPRGTLGVFNGLVAAGDLCENCDAPCSWLGPNSNCLQGLPHYTFPNLTILFLM
jgi:hypothetical protein